MNDVNASSKLHRDAFQALIAHVVNRIPHTIQEAIANSGLTLDQIDSSLSAVPPVFLLSAPASSLLFLANPSQRR